VKAALNAGPDTAAGGAMADMRLTGRAAP